MCSQTEETAMESNENLQRNKLYNGKIMQEKVREKP